MTTLKTSTDTSELKFKKLFRDGHLIIGGFFDLLLLRAFHAIQLQASLLDANALWANHILAREADTVEDGVALIALDTAIVEGEDHFVVATDLTDVCLC